MPRVRVLHLIKGLGRGGAEQLLVDGLRHADRSRFDMAYAWFLPHKDAVAADLRALGAEAACLEARTPAQILASAPRLSTFLRSSGTDVVHCHLPLAGVVGRVAASIAGIPVVYTEHNLMERYHRLTRWANLATWRRQRRVIAVSGEVAGSIRRHAGDRVPVTVVKNGIALDRLVPSAALRAEGRRLLNVDAEAPVVGTVAVFRTQKRLDEWLRVAQRIAARRPDVRFVLVGDGSLRSDLERLSADLGLPVVFPGLQRDVTPFLAAMDLFLISSQFEGLPLALLEAMAMERPVVATAVGGIPEVIADGVSGRLHPVHDVDGLARSTLELLDDSVGRAAMGTAARTRIVEGFSMSRMAAELEQIYSEVVHAGRG